MADNKDYSCSTNQHDKQLENGVEDSLKDATNSDTILQTDHERPDEILLLAATCVEDALEGRTLLYKKDPVSITQYRIYSNPIRQWTTIFFMWWILCLAIFENPAVSGAELPNWATMLMEIICLGIFMVRFWRLSRFVPRKILLRDPKNIVVLLTVIVTLIDMIVYIAMINSSASENSIRVSRILRPLFLVNMNESRQIRRAFRNIRNTVPDIFSVLVLFFFSIALFSLMAFKLFESRNLAYRTGEPYFQNYWDSYWDLYVLVTTANSPDVMMPAYDYSGWFVLFFFSYIIVNTYIFMNMFLAVIYNSYKTHLQREIKAAITEKHDKLCEAFDLLKTETTDGQPYITLQKWKALTHVVSEAICEQKVMLLWRVLGNDEETGGITKERFLMVADAINVRLIVDRTEKNIFARNCNECFRSKLSQILISAVNHRAFVYAFDLLIILNAVCIALDLEETEWFFLSIFMVEIGLRMYAVGPQEYFNFDRLWNWFDFVIITAAFVATVVEASLDELNSFPREALDVLLVLRCLRLVKIVGNVETFTIVVGTIVNIAPTLLTYGGVLMMVYYAFAIVGMEAFSGKISFVQSDVTNCSDTKLKGSEFERMGYCQLNFNDVAHSFVTLFILMVVNQWHVITQGYVLLTSKAARLYFITFHLVVVILILNIIVAFVLEVFILEYTAKSNSMESTIEKELGKRGTECHDNPTFNSTEMEVVERESRHPESPEVSGHSCTFRINKGHKNIEVLLQRMFYTSSET